MQTKWQKNESTPQFRVFVSSTFADFRAERDYLDEVVFPRVQWFCEQRGARFQQVDLRWGISEIAAREMRVAELCELELKRCQELSPRPNFLVLSGDRYGWCPPPRTIDESDWKRISQVISQSEQRVLNAAYSLDEFAIPPRRLFRHENVDVTDPVAEILRNAAATAFPDETHRRLPFEASITHQEIWQGALIAETAANHVFVFGRHFVDLPSTMIDNEWGEFADYDSTGTLDSVKYARQKRLRESLINLLPASSTFTVESQCHSWAQRPLLEDFGRRLEKHLCLVIQEELAAWHRSTEAGVTLRNAEDEVDVLLADSVPREQIIAKLLQIADRTSDRPAFVVGAGGTGKSTLLAMLVRRLRETDTKVIWVSVGTNGMVSDLTSFLNVVNGKLASMMGAQSEHADHSNTAAAEFARLLNSPTIERVLVVLDGLDQLQSQDRAHELWWLPTSVNPCIRLIASAALQTGDKSTLAQVLFARSAVDDRIEVEDLGPNTALDAVDRSLAIRGRCVTGRQRQYVQSALLRNNSALFARLISHVLETQASFSDPLEFPSTSRELFQCICSRWASESENGLDLVKEVVGALALSRDGLTEEEILDVIDLSEGIHLAVRRRFPLAPIRRHIPFAVWSRLRRNLQPFIVESSVNNQLSLFHGEVRSAATEWAFPTIESRRNMHVTLARFFLHRGLRAVRGGGKEDRLITRDFAGAVYHAIESGQSSILRELSNSTVLNSLDRYLGVGRTQLALENACRSLGKVDSVDWKCLSEIAKTFLRRHEKLEERNRPDCRISDLLYAGEFAAADNLIRAHNGTQKQLCHLAAAGILKSIGQYRLAETHQRQASDLSGIQPELSSIQKGLITSLREPADPVAARSGDDPAELQLPVVLRWWHYITLAACTSILTLAMSLHSIAVVIFACALLIVGIACVEVISDGRTALLERLGGFALLGGLLSFVASIVQQLATHPCRLCVRWLCSRFAEAGSRSQILWASWVCYLAESARINLNPCRPLMSPTQSSQILDFATNRAAPLVGARILFLYSESLPFHDNRLILAMKNIPKSRLNQLIAALNAYADLSRPGLSLIRAVANADRLPESTRFLARQLNRIPELLERLPKPKRSWVGRRIANEKNLRTKIEMIDVLREFPRAIRAELLLMTDQPDSDSLDGIWAVIVRRPIAVWRRFRLTHPAERFLLAIPWAVGAYFAWNLLSPVCAKPLDAITLLITSAMMLGMASAVTTYFDWLKLVKNQFQTGRFAWSGPLRLQFHMRHRQPPWDWSKWLPAFCGWNFFQLLMSPRADLANGRSEYGASLDDDLDRYSREWSELVQRYGGNKRRLSQTLAPPLYAYLGPSGLAELLLARLVVDRGWRAAIDGPAFPPEAWERVVKTLMQPSWLNRSPEAVADILAVPAAARAMLAKPFPKPETVPATPIASSLENLQRNVATHSARVSDMKPAILHRTVVVAVSAAIVLFAVHPLNPLIAPLAELTVDAWIFVALICGAYFLPDCESVWPRLISGGFAYFCWLILLIGIGGDGHSVDLQSNPALIRAQFVSAFIPACLPLIFFSPFTVALFRGSLRWNPTRLQIMTNRIVAILSIPFFGAALSWAMFIYAAIWVEGEKLLNAPQ